MEPVLRAAVVYLFLMVLFRIAGKRTLAQMSAFDVILLLVIGEATQQSLLGEDFSLANAFLVIGTLVGIDVSLAWAKHRSKAVEDVLEEPPLVIVVDGRPLRERMDKERIDDADVLHAARESHGLERMEQIRYAVLEAGGGISVVPRWRTLAPEGASGQHQP